MKSQSCSNFACAYALTKDTKNALKYLENSLIKKEISVEYTGEDDDWAAYKNDVGFTGLLKKNNIWRRYTIE